MKSSISVLYSFYPRRGGIKENIFMKNIYREFDKALEELGFETLKGHIIKYAEKKKEEFEKLGDFALNQIPTFHMWLKSRQWETLEDVEINSEDSSCDTVFAEIDSLVEEEEKKALRKSIVSALGANTYKNWFSQASIVKEENKLAFCFSDCKTRTNAFKLFGHKECLKDVPLRSFS